MLAVADGAGPDGEGLFEGPIAGDPQPVRYVASGQGSEWSVTDP